MRPAATAFANSRFSVSLDLETPQIVAFYMVDYDTYRRSQEVVVVDSITNSVLQRQVVKDFHGGVWLVFRLSGAVRVDFSRLSGSNAVLSGIVFGSR